MQKGCGFLTQKAKTIKEPHSASIVSCWCYAANWVLNHKHPMETDFHLASPNHHWAIRIYYPLLASFKQFTEAINEHFVLLFCHPPNVHILVQKIFHQIHLNPSMHQLYMLAIFQTTQFNISNKPAVLAMLFILQSIMSRLQFSAGFKQITYCIA